MVETVLRYASAVAIALVVLVMLLVVLLSVYRGLALNSPQMVGLLATVATLASIIVNLLRTNQVATKQNELVGKINGHLEHHEALADIVTEASKGQGGK